MARVARLPLYHETKVLFVVWLWHPRTQGAPHCYAAYVAPLLRRHEPALDAQLAEAGATVGGALGRQYRAAADYVSTSFLQLVAALPQRPTQQAADDGGGGGGGGGAAGPAFSPRTATEAAAAAFAAGPPPAAPHAKVF